MSDPYNVNPSDDKHAQWTNFDDLDATEYVDPTLKQPKGKKKKGEAIPTAEHTPQNAYEIGMEELSSIDFELVRSIQGNFAYHFIYLQRKPEPIKGIKYPEDFTVRVPMSRQAEYGLLQDKLQALRDKWGDFVYKFWEPLLMPDKAKSKPLYGHTLNLIFLDKQNRKFKPVEELGISLDGNCRQAPIKWIPPREWFSKSIQQLQLSDIITIFPKAELEMLSLILGRLVAGKSGNLHIGKDAPIKHTARMAGVTIGDPGLGKSTLYNNLFGALSKVGYTQSTFRNLDDRFNLSDVALSDIVYKDDTVTDTLKAFLKSETTKIIITNGEVKVEFKGVDAFYVDSYPVIILNANEFNPRLSFSIDTGTADRVKFLTSYREGEINLQPRSEVVEASPDLRPFAHLEWLANKLDVSIDALMLWVFRLSADAFLEAIEPIETGENKLELTVKHLTTKLRQQHYKLATRQLISLAFLWYFLTGHHTDKARVSLAGITWNPFLTWLKNLYNSESTLMRSLISKHAEVSNNVNHPGRIINILDPESVKAAQIKMLSEETMMLRAGQSFKNAIENVFKELYTVTGFPLSHDYIWLNSNYEAARAAIDEVELIAKAIKGHNRYSEAFAKMEGTHTEEVGDFI